MRGEAAYIERECKGSPEKDGYGRERRMRRGGEKGFKGSSKRAAGRIPHAFRCAAALLLCAALTAALPFGVKGEELKESELYAAGACLMDGESGRVLYGKEEHTPMAMASTTKIMTCILTLEQGDLSAAATASKRAASAPKVRLGVREGQQFLVGDLLYALMLESFNDAAVMIAETVAGSVEEFAARMNQKAEEIGCADTHFVTPNGLDASDEGGEHHTTAADLARIMRYCVSQSPKAEEFLTITQAPSYSFWDCGQTAFYNCTNHNAFLNMMDGALSGKTGFTNKAGYCYVGALQRDGKLLIVSLLACGWPNNKSYKWSDTRKLMTYALQNYEYRDVFDESPLPVLPVENGQYEELGIGEEAVTALSYGVPASELSLDLLLKEDEQVEVVRDLPQTLAAPVRQGQQVGCVRYLLNGQVLKEYPVFAERTVEEKDFAWCLRKVEENYRL